MSGLFGSVTVKGNQITDFAKQTASVGVPIPFGYGKFPANGQVIWTDDVVTHVTKKKQGKGGIKTEEYTYTRSYAIAFCEGPIYGYLTITRSGKVVYTTDPNAEIEDKDFAAKWAEKVAFYFGTRTQMPDSTIEAKEGAGEVSAFRDLAYIVVENDDVTDGAGAIPEYQAIIVGSAPEVYMTSRPYALEATDGMESDVELYRAQLLPQPSINEDRISPSIQLLSISRFGGQVAYSEQEDELQSSIELLSINRFGSETSYSEQEDELQSSVELLTINRFGGEVNYATTPDELSSIIELLSITRSIP